MTYAWHEAPNERSYCPVSCKIVLGALHFLFVEQAHSAYGTASKGIDDGASEIAGCSVIDEGAQNGAESSTKNYKDYIHARAGSCCAIGCRRHYELAGHGNDCALKGHQEGYGPIVEVIDTPSNKRGHYV